MKDKSMKNLIGKKNSNLQYFIYLFICILVGCSNQKDHGRNKLQEEKILKKISSNAPRTKKISEIVGKNIAKICIQGKYTPRKEIFEKSVGRPVNTYKEIGRKNLTIWWLFDESNQSYWIEIPDEIATPSRDIESICHNSDSAIHFAQDGEHLTYNIERK